MTMITKESAEESEFRLSDRLLEASREVILASASPRRKELFTTTGLTFKTEATHIEERSLPGELPGEAVQRLALEKADAIVRKYPTAWVIGADTAVVSMGRILGKPSSAEQADSMLTLLSGRTHRVLTGVAVVCRQREVREGFVECTRVTFRTLSCENIAAYVASGEPLDKAGAYGIQAQGGQFVSRIEGSYANVVGLPMERLGEVLERLWDGRL